MHPPREARRRRARPLRAVVLAGALALAGAACPRERPPEAEPGPPPELGRERLVALLSQPESLFGPTREDAVASLGEPHSSRAEEAPRAEDPQLVDRRHHLRWQDVELTFVETPGAEHAWLDTVRVTAKTRGWPPGELLGASEEAVADWLGAPNRRTDEGHWVYADEMVAAYTRATLRFAEGRVTAVVWEAEGQ